MQAASNSLLRAEVSVALAHVAVDNGGYDYSLYYLRDSGGNIIEKDASCRLDCWDRRDKQYPILFEPTDPDVVQRDAITAKILPILDAELDKTGHQRVILDYEGGRLSLAVSK